MSMISAHDLEGKTVAFVNFATGTAIDLKDGFTSPPDGTPCIGWQAHLNENQQWKCVKYQHGPDDQPQFRLQNIRASGRAMDLYNGGTSDGTEIVGWQYSGFGGHQLWCIRPVGYFPAHGTIVKIENIPAGTFVTLQGGSAQYGPVRLSKAHHSCTSIIAKTSWTTNNNPDSLPTCLDLLV
ncbi:hypothetical protein NW764_008075 [Fusarium oxysporum]|uniref:Ricin B lectin domain-containing protein n=1 Tax=Fusarium oxysporum TaxID=5507 RepID=A0A8H5A330_FUSOX|nr:hypothetical protein FOXYS1_11434 [Fusarium oxysporum]KAJ4278042.1 hypothetical protein NW764_008075 [Fusarium oxysporum]RKK32098.1 hypothetical protein BFJ67_g14915 [Fusarium oxysporum f. sp. cepae]